MYRAANKHAMVFESTQCDRLCSCKLHNQATGDVEERI